MDINLDILEEAAKRSKGKCPHYRVEKRNEWSHCLDCNGYFFRRSDESLMVHLVDYILYAEASRSNGDIEKRKRMGH